MKYPFTCALDSIEVNRNVRLSSNMIYRLKRLVDDVRNDRSAESDANTVSGVRDDP